ncbi:hypothetical protein TRAPUB_6908 [Trametes pubescens]|uniref:Uncharacterized protein n=1 Tax=Trametes pubescens TaxID=154538 RepID=A0A1M2V4Y3_TRAPU|nr:hypothetical protein TRAPUB_6908 [Trametes pubescens]
MSGSRHPNRGVSRGDVPPLTSWDFGDSSTRVSPPLPLVSTARPVKYSPTRSVTEKRRNDNSTGPNVAELSKSVTPAGSISWHLRCTFRSIGGRFDFFDAGAGGNLVPTNNTLLTILEQHGDKIKSMVFDASELPNPKPENTDTQPLRTPPVAIPLPSDVATSSSPLKLPQLTTLEVITSWRTSMRSVLLFLRCTPRLARLTVRTSRTNHILIFPENCEDLPRVEMPYMQNVVLDGFFADTVEDFLSKLIIRPATTRIDIYITPAFPCNRISALPVVLRGVRHVCVSFKTRERYSEDKDPYLFSFYDISKRVQVHWAWEMRRGDPVGVWMILLNKFKDVRSLTVSFRDVTLTRFADWYTILLAFPKLQYLTLEVDPRLGIRPAAFSLRGAFLLGTVTNKVPLVFALGIAQHCARDPFPGGIPHILRHYKLYSRTCRYLVDKVILDEETRNVSGER